LWSGTKVLPRYRRRQRTSRLDGSAIGRTNRHVAAIPADADRRAGSVIAGQSAGRHQLNGVDRRSRIIACTQAILGRRLNDDIRCLQVLEDDVIAIVGRSSNRAHSNIVAGIDHGIDRNVIGQHSSGQISHAI